MALIEKRARGHERTYSDEHRKLLGTHYTPDAIVDYIVRRSLKPFTESTDSLKILRVLDPACGSGLFLLKAFDVLAERWMSLHGMFGQRDARDILAHVLFGIDIDEKAVLATRKHLLEKAGLTEEEVPEITHNITIGDSLSVKPSTLQFGLYDPSPDEIVDASLFARHSFHAIVGNPPYVRIQHTTRNNRERYVTSYSTASGRFDLSALFVELSEYLLIDDGRLGFIVSNKTLSTASARKLRAFLLSNFALKEIVDLADTKLFDAAILPMIIIAARSKHGSNEIAYSAVTEAHHLSKHTVESENLLEAISNAPIPYEANVMFENRRFQLRRFYATLPSVKAKVWTFHNDRESRVLSKLRSQSKQSLSDIAEKISVGLKTTADSVFIKPMTAEFVRKCGFEPDVIFPLLESHNIERWTYHWNRENDLYVLYPHIERNGRVTPIDLDNYPNVKKYLETYRSQLEARMYLQESDRKWFEIWVHQSPEDFRQRKLVTPDISTHNRFALDNGDFFINGTCFYVILGDKSDASYLSVLGLLNSTVMEYYHKTTSGNALYSKRYRYWSSYIGSYPIADKLLHPSELRSKIIRNVARLLASNNADERKSLEEENDRLCYALFDLTQDDIAEIKRTLLIHSSPANSLRGKT